MTSRPLLLALAGIATFAVAVPAWVVSHPPRIERAHARPAALARLRQRVVAPTELPPVEPIKFVDLSPDEARAFNATVPFSTAPNPPARPFRFLGTPEEKARATDCLAAAVVYEAGDDAVGERAVAQVILNRLRHPAFPKTVCGVVFEGAERTTGCQFTFTCDHALTRWTPNEAAWRRAREVATAALAGSVYKPVGYATHYHTDWVVPYWQASLDKITAVHTHLFFRWSGWWGTPPAFNRSQSGTEPTVTELAVLSDAHRTGAALAEADAALGEAAIASLAAAVVGTPSNAGPDADGFVAVLDARASSDTFRATAEQTCGDRPHCKFLGWVSAQQVPKSADAVTPDQMNFMSFSYLRDRASGFEKALYNCRQFKRADPRECMKQQVALTIPPVAGTPTKSDGTAPAAGDQARGPEDLPGVRRRTPAPAPSPGPSATPRS